MQGEQLITVCARSTEPWTRPWPWMMGRWTLAARRRTRPTPVATTSSASRPARRVQTARPGTAGHWPNCMHPHCSPSHWWPRPHVPVLPDAPACRLARKAESARQARLRHKQFVTDLQDQAATLRSRIKELETHCTTGPGSASVALRELKQALQPDQLSQLQKWCAARSADKTEAGAPGGQTSRRPCDASSLRCARARRLVEAQGENHVLTKYENGTVSLPPAASLPPAPEQPTFSVSGGVSSSGATSAPIAIGSNTTHWRGGGAGIGTVSPMESDEDPAHPVSRCALGQVEANHQHHLASARRVCGTARGPAP